jgi:siroheme synthase (precorrin-2 oxidase/ferrochelatase)
MPCYFLSNGRDKLIVSTGTVYGKRYHTVSPTGCNWNVVSKWCQETFGASTGSIWAEQVTPNPGERWYENNAKFWFREEEDLTLFLLRWT